MNLNKEQEELINAAKAADLGIKNDALVEVSSEAGSGVLKAYVTDLIHPEAVFMIHGFGHRSKRMRLACCSGGSASAAPAGTHCSTWPRRRTPSPWAPW